MPRPVSESASNASVTAHGVIDIELRKLFFNGSALGKKEERFKAAGV